MSTVGEAYSVAPQSGYGLRNCGSGAGFVLPNVMLAEALFDMATLRQTIQTGFARRVTRQDATPLKRTKDGVYSAVPWFPGAGFCRLLTSPFCGTGRAGHDWMRFHDPVGRGVAPHGLVVRPNAVDGNQFKDERPLCVDMPSGLAHGSMHVPVGDADVVQEFIA